MRQDSIYQKAVERLCYGGPTEMDRSFAETIVKELAIKATPMTPILKQTGAGGTWETPFCPCCDKNIQSANDFTFRFCPHCGQAIDWTHISK